MASRSTLTATAIHAYVTDFGGGPGTGTLLQFDIRNGIAVGPGRVIVKDLTQPIGVAVDRSGLVYVAESQSPLHAIDVYRINGSRVDRIRRLLLDKDNEPEYLAVDGNGYIYAGLNYTNVGWFSPDANGPVRPHYLYNTDGAFIIAVDAAGNLYKQATLETFVYEARPGHPVHAAPARKISARRFYAYGGFAVAGAELLMGYGYYDQPPDGDHWDEVAAVPETARGPTSPLRVMKLSHGCSVHSPPSGLGQMRFVVDGLEMAVHGRYLYQTCEDDNGRRFVAGVYTFYADENGVVTPLGFARGPIVSIMDIAVGP